MKWVALVWALALSCVAETALARRVTVTRARLDAAGATRLSDALQLVDGWAPVSNDGYTWMPTPRALALPRSTSWAVVLNGQLLDVTVFDATHLELVPVAMAEVDSIVFVDEADRSSVGASWDASSARIEIHAAHATRGWTVGATASGGNEVGDPGPYRYTDLATPNVDAIGVDGSLWLARGGHDGYVSLSGAMLQHPFTDPAMRTRTTDALADLPLDKGDTASALGALSASGYRHVRLSIEKAPAAERIALLSSAESLQQRFACGQARAVHGKLGAEDGGGVFRYARGEQGLQFGGLGGGDEGDGSSACSHFTRRVRCTGFRRSTRGIGGARSVRCVRWIG